MCVGGGLGLPNVTPVPRATLHHDALGLKLWTWNRGVSARAGGLPWAALSVLLGSRGLETPGLAGGRCWNRCQQCSDQCLLPAKPGPLGKKWLKGNWALAWAADFSWISGEEPAPSISILGQLLSSDALGG